MRFLGIVLMLALGARPAAASSIGVFTSADGAECSAIVPPFTPFFIYVGAVLGGDAAAGGIVDAECRLTGFDPAWFTTVTQNPKGNLEFNPGNLVLGGRHIGFAACETGSFITLFKIEIVALGPIPGRILGVAGRTDIVIPGFDCPFVRLCDAPVATHLCVSGGEAFLNMPGHVCSVGVESQSWAGVKQLFE